MGKINQAQNTDCWKILQTVQKNAVYKAKRGGLLIRFQVFCSGT